MKLIPIHGKIIDGIYMIKSVERLRFDLSPEYQNNGKKAIFGYEYRYDDRGNIVKKFLPQCEYIQYWYDNDNRLIYMQDGRMREKGLYRFYLYDKLSRVVVEGTCTSCNRGITNIEYELRYNPRLIQFSDGSQTEYVYSALGEKLKTIHRTAVPDYKVLDSDKGDLSDNPLPSDTSLSLFKHAPANISEFVDTFKQGDMSMLTSLSIDSTEYIGSFIFENGHADKYLFPGGYYSYAAGLPTRTGGDGGGYYYLTDHLGNNRVVVNANGDIEQTTHYYPFGAVYADAGKSPDLQKFKYTGKELDLTHGLNTYDHGARQNYSILGVWDRIDQMAESYPNVSPYAFVMNNPVFLTDYTGMAIDPNSQDEWDKRKQKVVNKRDKLQRKIEKLNNKAINKGWSSEKLACKIGNRQERVNSLNRTLSNLTNLEESSQVYSLKSGAGEVGRTMYDIETGNIVFCYQGTSGFVHETTHGGQFETGEIAFNAQTGLTLCQDVYDEVSAYEAQFGYSPSSVSGLTSSSSINSFSDITASWVQGITLSNGSKIYSPGGYANTSSISININTNYNELIIGYPNLKNINPNFKINTIKDIPNIIYK